MFISVFDIFKIGIGPSSSHTMGPMTAAGLFIKSLRQEDTQPDHIRVSLHGSLAFTGKGHGTDRAVLLGLSGYSPETIDASSMDRLIKEIHSSRQIASVNGKAMHCNPDKDIIFDYGPPLPGHANGMQFFAYDDTRQLILQQTYYSIGGGFVVLGDDQNMECNENVFTPESSTVPYPFMTAGEALSLGKMNNISLLEMKKANELSQVDLAGLEERLDTLWQVMEESIRHGLAKDGILPGGLKVKRRAKHLYQQVEAEIAGDIKSPSLAHEWLVLAAIAVNEENAGGGKIVTAPTNGAAGVIPAVISYYLKFYQDARASDVRSFLLVAAAVGGIIKHNSSISGAEVGCQGEVGSASAMAAAGLCAVLGGTNEQIENAAEIALEHHLGMTCDPVNGLVQVPCIERNGFGAVKAVTAASLALRGDGQHLISLDKCIRTMYETGLDMNVKYKETSQGGLAVNMIEC